MDIQKIRAERPLANGYTYLDTARTGAISTGTADALKQHIDDFMINGALHREEWIAVKEKARDKVAQIMEVPSEDVGFLTDVSTGMSFLATAMKGYKKVLLIKDDFPSVGIPWIRSGYEVIWLNKEADLSIDLNKCEEALKKGIDILAISWVQYNSGFRIDLDKLGDLCEQYDTKLVVDGTQGFCAFPLSLGSSKIHVFMASAFKWMTAGYGVAVIYIDPQLRNELKFEAGGWNNLIDFFGTWEGEENYKATTELVELAHPKYANLITLDHALSEFIEIGINHIQERVARLSSYLQEQLIQSGIVALSNYSEKESSAIRLMRGNKELFHKLENEKVKVTFREDYFRVAPHFYNQESDIDKLINLCR